MLCNHPSTARSNETWAKPLGVTGFNNPEPICLPMYLPALTPFFDIGFDPCQNQGTPHVNTRGMRGMAKKKVPDPAWLPSRSGTVRRRSVVVRDPPELGTWQSMACKPGLSQQPCSDVPGPLHDAAQTPTSPRCLGRWHLGQAAVKQLVILQLHTQLLRPTTGATECGSPAIPKSLTVLGWVSLLGRRDRLHSVVHQRH